MTYEQINHMVNRFLNWKLPENFNPDGGVSFKKMFNEHTDHPMKHEPSGTNLLDADQAAVLVRHMIEGLPQDTFLLNAAKDVLAAQDAMLHFIVEVNPKIVGEKSWSDQHRRHSNRQNAAMQALIAAVQKAEAA